MKVLVTAGSKHGATYGIAEHIAKTLIDRSFEIELVDPAEVTDLTGYDAVVLGSAVYAGNWRKDAVEFAERFSADLQTLPVWIFSSGPLGDEDDNESALNQLDALMEDTGARSHTWFDGKLIKEDLSFAERAIVKVVGAPYGDFRDWDDIGAWAENIADELG
ncbi:MAG: flavodoxin domain-containing protein [Acidimicrobiia bacterium]|nr:flavodoxin domain-containing protein [Acidimicrobiia bacterium]